MKIVCVYKTGGDFDAEYVTALHSSLSVYSEDFLCLTDAKDVPQTIHQQALTQGWKGWWSKLEMFSLDSDVLYFDLDTVITGDISDMIEFSKIKHKNLVMLKDFYFPQKPASGIMYIPNEIGTTIYDEFIKNPARNMSNYRGDQEFIGSLNIDIDRWQDILGVNYIASYKAHISKSAPKHLNSLKVDPAKSKIVCFHGKPRVRDVNGWNLKFKLRGTLK